MLTDSFKAYYRICLPVTIAGWVIPSHTPQCYLLICHDLIIYFNFSQLAWHVFPTLHVFVWRSLLIIGITLATFHFFYKKADFNER